MATDIVPANVRIGKGKSISLVEIQELLERRNVQEERVPLNTKAARVAEAKRRYELDPTDTLVEIQDRAKALADAYDGTITMDSIPLSQDDINRLSDEFYQLSQLKTQIEALETRYRSLFFAHFDEQHKDSTGRPPHQMPCKAEATGPGPRYVFERRGGARRAPKVDLETLKGMLPEELRGRVFKKVYHDPTPAWIEEVFDETTFGTLVDAGLIDLESLREILIPGEWGTTAFWKTLVEE